MGCSAGFRRARRRRVNRPASGVWFGARNLTIHPQPYTFISQKEFMKTFCKSQLPYKFINLSLIITIS